MTSGCSEESLEKIVESLSSQLTQCGTMTPKCLKMPESYAKCQVANISCNVVSASALQLRFAYAPAAYKEVM